MQDPRLAAAWLFALPEMDSGQTMDEETKKAVWLDYLVSGGEATVCRKYVTDYSSHIFSSNIKALESSSSVTKAT